MTDTNGDSFLDTRGIPLSERTWYPSNPSRFAPTLAQVYACCKENRTESALDVVFDAVDTLLTNGQFEACDRLLQECVVAKLNASTAIGFLSVTVCARDRLRSRTTFAARVKSRLLSLSKTAEEVNALLDGLL